MELNLDYIEGQTPLDEEEKNGLLIDAITTRAELDEFEQINIEKAVAWTLTKKFSSKKVISADFITQLHKRMFGEVWLWAGQYRHSDKNLGVQWQVIAVELSKLFGDMDCWLKNKTFDDDETAIRFKHRIVSIHCFANGNGRHSRLMADVVAKNIFGRDEFTWGSAGLTGPGEARKNYLTAIRLADSGNIRPLVNFARS